MGMLKSKGAKVISAFACLLVMFMVGSWTTNQTLKQNFDGYKNYTIDEVVTNVLNKEGGVNEQLIEIKNIVTTTNSNVELTNEQMYQSWVIDINKYYTMITTGKAGNLTKDCLTKVSNYWDSLPDKYKTVEVVEHEKYVVNWLVENCK